MLLKELRTARNMSKARLAELSGLSRTYIAELEAEYGSKSPTLRTLEKLADALGINVEELIS